MAKTSSKNSVTSKTVAPAPAKSEGADLDGVVLSNEERAKLSMVESQVVRLKIALADADLQLARFEAARNDLRQKVEEATKAYVDGVVGAAKAHGIDLDDKAVRWNFDTNKMTFTRQG